MSNWKTVDQCKICGHIYHDYTTMSCPSCGTNNFKKIPGITNMYVGSRKVISQGIPCNDNLEKIMVRKRLFRGWEAKEVEPNMQHKRRVEYTAPKFESDLLKLTSDDESKILELCKDYLAGTWVITEISKTDKTKFKKLKVLESKQINGYFVITYITDKTKDLYSDLSNDNIYDSLQAIADYCSTSSNSKRYINLDSLNKFNDLLARTSALENSTSLTCSCSTVTAYSTNGQPIASFDGGVHITYE